MRIQLIAIGSTGDVQPMIMLGKALRRRGHTVRIAAFEALRDLVLSAGLEHFQLPGDAQRYIGSIIQPGANPFTYLSRLERGLQSTIPDLIERLYQACEGMDAVITAFFGATLYAITEKLHIPLFETHYCLIAETGDACLPVMPQLPLGRTYNRLTYRLAYRMIGAVESHYAAPLCREKGMPVRTMRHGPDYQIGAWRVPVLCAFSEAVVPRPPEWSDNIHMVGFWEDSEPCEPAPALDAFLRAGDAPVYIGFGSMTSGDMGEALHAVLDMLAVLNLRAVLSAGWGGLQAVSLPDSVFLLDEYVSHRALFDRVQAVVHHGGAGTTAAGLMAGRPTLAVPFGSDQYYWGDRIHALGCGPKPLPRTKLTAKRLTQRMADLLGNPQYRTRAQALSQTLRDEDGAENAAALIERSLSSWKS